MSDIKLMVKNGKWEISYEGPEEFLTNNLQDVLVQLSELSIWNQSHGNDGEPVPNPSHDEQNAQNHQIQQMTLNNVCLKLKVETGPDLILAACAYLTIMQGREILATMREARYYKSSYSRNLSSYLQTLVKQDKLRERASETYAITPAYEDEVRATLA
jgi:hypothetical protein